MRRVAADARSLSFDHSILIAANPTVVLEAFFDPAALAVWWRTSRSVTAARPLGVYAVEWTPATELDDVLGRLGGVFYGIVMEYRPGRELFVAEAWWLPPDGNPVGPMSFQVNCTPRGDACRLRIRQSGCDDSPRSRRYYDVLEREWHTSLAALKEYAEARA
jgi:uncharacterized protein YndB with AHSA1/START domain